MPMLQDALTKARHGAWQVTVVMLDRSGTISSVNQAWIDFGIANGLSRADADSVGANFLQVWGGSGANTADKHATAARAGIAALLAGKLAQFELEFPCHGPLGERWLLLRGLALAGTNGGAVLTYEDITVRRQLEPQRALLVAELLDFKAALDAHAIVAITDARGAITYVNDRFCAISKWSRDELLGQDHRIVNSGHHPKEFIRNLWETIRSGAIWHGELKNRAKDGSIYWVDTTIVPFLGSDRVPAQYIAIRAEITHGKLLQLHNNEVMQELQSANRELREFAHVVSHDLKAPLRGIASVADWLVTDYSDKLGAEGCEQLNLIANRVKRLSGMIDGILTYSRVGRDRGSRASVALDALVRSTIDLLAPPAHIEVVVAADLPQLDIEAVKIQQVFQNLLSNALDFIDKPVGRVEVGCVRDTNHWHFSVSDNGVGIEPRHFERIFLLFQTLASRDARERTGVGLALVKRIVEREGGRVWVE
jgi:two-component system, LuxR family, sensor kinase FixL